MKTMRKKQNVTPKVGRRDFADARGESSMSSDEGTWGRSLSASPPPIPAGTPTGYYILPLNLNAATPVRTISSPMPMRATITVSPSVPTVSEEEDEVARKKQSLERLKELQERNRSLPPHMRSSYVVEELPGLGPSLCDEQNVRP